MQRHKYYHDFLTIYFFPLLTHVALCIGQNAFLSFNALDKIHFVDGNINVRFHDPKHKCWPKTFIMWT